MQFLGQTLNYTFTLIMFIIRIIVVGYFVTKFREFQGYYDSYRHDVASSVSAVQATQMSNEYILGAISSIGELVVVIAVALVIESAYRGRRRVSVVKEQ